MERTGPPVATFDPKEAVKVPAIILMVLGGMMIVSSLFGLIVAPDKKILETLLANPNLPPDVIPVARAFTNRWLNAPPVIIGIFLLTGAERMRSMRGSWLAAVATCLLATIPCFSPCSCLVGTPVGIWALVTLMKPEVKAAFR